MKSVSCAHHSRPPFAPRCVAVWPWPLPEVKTKDNSWKYVLEVQPGVKGRVRPKVHGWRAGHV